MAYYSHLFYLLDKHILRILVSLKPVLNWTKICFTNIVRLICRTLANIAGLREPSLGISSNCDEAIFGVQKASFSMFWEYSASSANIAPDWLRAERESSPVDEEEIKIKMDDRVDTSLASEGIVLFVDLWEVQPCLWDPK